MSVKPVRNLQVQYRPFFKQLDLIWLINPVTGHDRTGFLDWISGLDFQTGFPDSSQYYSTERDEVEKKAEEITKLINPDNDSSDDDHVTGHVTEVPAESQAEPEAPKVPFWVGLENILWHCRRFIVCEVHWSLIE